MKITKGAYGFEPYYIGPKINRVKKGLFLQYETTKTDIKIQGTSGVGTPERGTLEELSRKYAATVAEINSWRDEFIQNGTDGFKRKPEDSKLSRAERKIGQLELELYW